MELDNLKKNWSSLKGKELEPEKIKAITQANYRSRFGKLWLAEFLTAAFYFYFVVLIIFRFEELGSGFLPILGSITVAVLLLFPVLRMIGLFRLYQSGRVDEIPSEAVRKFANRKIWFQKIQQINLGILFFLMLALFVLAVKIYNEYDVTQSIYFWLIAVTLSLLFVFVFKNISKKYRKAIDEAESLLTEIEK